MNDRKMAEIRMPGRGLLQELCGTSHPEGVAVAGPLEVGQRDRGNRVHHNRLIPLGEDRVDHITRALEGCVEIIVYKMED